MIEGGAQTHPERCMALRSFPQVVHQLMERFSKEQDVSWLQSGLVDGHFDYANAFNKGTPEQPFKRIRSALAFLKTVSHTSAPLGVVETPMTFLSLSIPDPQSFVPFVDALVNRLVEEKDRLNPTQNIGEAWGELRKVLGLALVGAIAADSVASVRKLLDAHSGLVEQTFACTEIGDALRDAVAQPNKSLFTPYFFAMQLGREDCMRALVEAGANLNRIGTREIDGQNRNEKATQRPIALTNHMDFTPMCRQPAYRLALEQWSEAEARNGSSPKAIGDALHSGGMAMLDAMTNTGPTVRKRAYIECFEAVGAYEHAPTESFMHACMGGRADVAEKIQGKIDWDKLRARPEDGVKAQADSFAVLALKAPAPSGEAQRVGLMLMKKTMAEGVFDQVFAPTAEFNLSSHSGTGRRLAQPVSLMIDKDHLGMLSLWMRQGMDPTKPHYEGCLSPLAYAEATGKDAIAHAMRTFLTRQKALSALDELDIPNTRTPSP